MSSAAVSTKPYEVVMRSPKLWEAYEAFRKECRRGGFSRLCLHSDWPKARHQRSRQLFVVLYRQDLLDQEEYEQVRRNFSGSSERLLVFPDKSPSEALLDRIFRLRIRSAERIHTPRFNYDTEKSFLHRFLAALDQWPVEETIADAWWEQDRLVVLSPTFERLSVPAESIPKVRAATEEERRAFKIDECGEFIYWPSQDVHMGWEQFEQAVDPRARLKAQQQSEEFNRAYGQAIRALRREKGLRQADVKGIDARTVGRIERGKTRASSKALASLAASLGMEPNAYLSAVAKKLSLA